MIRLLTIIALLIGAIAAASMLGGDPAAARIDGMATVRDGDTLEISGQLVRLHGIDAPEYDQTCRDAEGSPWLCGRSVARDLRDRIGGATVSCRPTGRDRYDRTIAVCEVDGIELNGWLVETGRATAYRRYSRDYVSAENRARSERVGLWAGTFDLPETVRRR